MFPQAIALTGGANGQAVLVSIRLHQHLDITIPSQASTIVGHLKTVCIRSDPDSSGLDDKLSNSATEFVFFLKAMTFGKPVNLARSGHHSNV